MQVTYRQFRAGSFTTWEEMLAGVAQFGTSLGPGAVRAISQSEDKGSAVVTVWHKPHADPTESHLEFRIFRGGSFTSWEQLFSEAAAFASSVGEVNIAAITQSEDKSDGLVVVWYWT